jgi:putative endonuclease
MKPGNYRKRIGKKGEDKAVNYLKQKGYRILEQNFRAERGEIDIIALDQDTLVFIEVKTKRHDHFGEPETWVDKRKQAQIGKIAQAYLQQQDIVNMDCRFDVIGIVFKNQSNEIRHFQDAFWLES